jgi:Ca2+-binding RTX toxin-like protein
VVRGGRGNDKLTGGEATDIFRGESGNDRLYAADGVAEDVHCGSGSDGVVADRTDRVRGCERVRRRP